MINLNQNLIIQEGEIYLGVEGKNFYLFVQNGSEWNNGEPSIDYSIIDKDMNLVDGGIFFYDDDVLTFGELFEYLGHGFLFDEHSSIIEDEELLEELHFAM